MKILVINCGSSSIKYKLFNMPGEDILAMGIVEKIGLQHSEIKIHNKVGNEIISEEPIADHREGIKYILNALTNEHCGCLKDLRDLNAVGHRVAHGGDKFNESVLINDTILSEIESFSDLAPIHNPHNLRGIEAIQKLVPGVKQIAVFDTAFHHTIPEHAFMYAIPYSYYEKYKIRRYGFHGTSHYYVSKRACEILNVNISKQKIVSCHLGNGSSVAAIKEGKSIDTSMGFTPAEGLIMGTRPGDLDVSILPYIMKKEDIDCESVNAILNEQSGMLGISGVSSDMREIEESITKDNNTRAKLSMEMFFYRIRKYIGAYAAVLNGIDILVFTGGIGENCHKISTGLCKGLDFLGIEINSDSESVSPTEERIISTDKSRVSVIVIPTNEEKVIAKETWQIISDNKLTENAS
jgi:acetate kinase